jgi:hypothetical protein
LIGMAAPAISPDKSGLSLPRRPGEQAMKSFVAAVAVAAILAFGASFVLNDYFQKPVEVAFSTGGVRL